MSEWINCLTSHPTTFQLYMWRHIDVQADWRRRWTYGRTGPVPTKVSSFIFDVGNLGLVWGSATMTNQGTDTGPASPRSDSHTKYISYGSLTYPSKHRHGADLLTVIPRNFSVRQPFCYEKASCCHKFIWSFLQFYHIENQSIALMKCIIYMYEKECSVLVRNLFRFN